LKNNIEASIESAIALQKESFLKSDEDIQSYVGKVASDVEDIKN